MAKKIEKNISNVENWNPEVCKYRHELVDQQYKNLETNHEETKNLIKEHMEEIKISRQVLKDKIQVTEASINEKIDVIDKSLTGNNGIGIFEQIRDLQKIIENTFKWGKRAFIVAFVLLILFFGGEIFDLTLGDIKNVFSKNEIKQIDPNLIEEKTK